MLALVPTHGGEVVRRALSNGSDGRPHEVHLLPFPNQTTLDAYFADPARLALAEERDQAVARIELFPVSLR